MCEWNDWADDLDRIATQSSVPLGLYQHVLYILPSSSDLRAVCGWDGIANIGCPGQVCSFFVLVS